MPVLEGVDASSAGDDSEMPLAFSKVNTDPNSEAKNDKPVSANTNEFKSKSLSDASVIVGFSANFISAPVLIFLNKWIYLDGHVQGVLLTCVHFSMTAMLLVVCLYLKAFQYKRVSILKVLPLSVTFCGFVVFTNLSLQFNSVGTYQVIKTMTTPCIIVIRYVFYNTPATKETCLSVIPIAIGVFLNSWYDVKFNALGIMFASIGVLVTSLYQVWVGEKQHEFQVNSMQLLFYQAPLSALLLVVIIPFIEPISNISNMFTLWPPETIFVVLLSGVVAFSVNLSIYWIIGNTSPVTYNMVGHLKFCLTLIGGYVIFHDSLNARQVCGIITTLSGVIGYTHFKLKENKKEALPVDNATQKV